MSNRKYAILVLGPVAAIFAVAMVAASIVLAQSSVPTHGLPARYIPAFDGAGIDMTALLGPYCESASESGGTLSIVCRADGETDAQSVTFTGGSDGVVDGGSVADTTLTLTRTGSLADVTITGLPSGGSGDTVAAGDGITITGTSPKTITNSQPYPTADQTKLAGIAAGAEVNVQSDWSTSDMTADSYIHNKPVIPPGATLSNATPAQVATAGAAGTGTSVSRADHVHQDRNTNITAHTNASVVTILSSTGGGTTISGASTSNAGVMTAAQVTTLNNLQAAGGGVTNLGYTAASDGGTVTSSTGANATLPVAGTLAGLMSAADKERLDALDIEEVEFVSSLPDTITEAQQNVLFALVADDGNHLPGFYHAASTQAVGSSRFFNTTLTANENSGQTRAGFVRGSHGVLMPDNSVISRIEHGRLEDIFALGTTVDLGANPHITIDGVRRAAGDRSTSPGATQYTVNPFPPAFGLVDGQQYEVLIEVSEESAHRFMVSSTVYHWRAMSLFDEVLDAPIVFTSQGSAVKAVSQRAIQDWVFQQLLQPLQAAVPLERETRRPFDISAITDFSPVLDGDTSTGVIVTRDNDLSNPATNENAFLALRPESGELQVDGRWLIRTGGFWTENDRNAVGDATPFSIVAYRYTDAADLTSFVPVQTLYADTAKRAANRTYEISQTDNTEWDVIYFVMNAPANAEHDFRGHLSIREVVYRRDFDGLNSVTVADGKATFADAYGVETVFDPTPNSVFAKRNGQTDYYPDALPTPSDPLLQKRGTSGEASEVHWLTWEVDRTRPGTVSAADAGFSFENQVTQKGWIDVPTNGTGTVPDNILFRLGAGAWDLDVQVWTEAETDDFTLSLREAVGSGADPIHYIRYSLDHTAYTRAAVTDLVLTEPTLLYWRISGMDEDHSGFYTMKATRH